MENGQDGALDLAVDATFQLDRFVETAWQGLGYASEATRVAVALAGYRNRKASPGSPQHPIPEELERATKLEAFSAEQLPHFPFLHSLAAFRLWAILEAAVEDWLREVLQNHAELRQRPAFASLEGPLVEFAAVPVQEQNEILIERQKRRFGSPLNRGVGRFEALLDTVGLGGPVAGVPRRTLLELAEVRNVVAHKNGKADARFIERCPWFPAQKDHLLIVTHRHFHRYVTAAHWYLVELSRRHLTLYPETERDPGKTLTEIVRLLTVLETRLGEMEKTLNGTFDES